MHRLISFRTVLILILMLTNFLIHGNAAAECPQDPCPEQTGAGTINDNPDMALKWAPNNPPPEISPGETLKVEADGGLPPYTWNISGSGVSLTSDNPTDESKNNISADCSATGSATITLSDSKKDDQDNFINTISGSVNADSSRFQFDNEKFGVDGIARNSKRTIYVIGGAPPFRWTISKSGFYFDTDRSEQEITTNTGSAVVYTNGSACGATAIQIQDSCGNSTTGYVRCSSGRWRTSSSPSCPIPGPQNAGTSYRIEGKYRVRQVYQQTYYHSSGGCENVKPCSAYNCEDRCSTNSNCHDTMGCTECITFRVSHSPYGEFPCASADECGNNTYKTNRCYCTAIFYLYEWVCR